MIVETCSPTRLQAYLLCFGEIPAAFPSHCPRTLCRQTVQPQANRNLPVGTGNGRCSCQNGWAGLLGTHWWTHKVMSCDKNCANRISIRCLWVQGHFAQGAYLAAAQVNVSSTFLKVLSEFCPVIAKLCAGSEDLDWKQQTQLG